MVGDIVGGDIIGGVAWGSWIGERVREGKAVDMLLRAWEA
jgi:hypothetical protein